MVQKISSLLLPFLLLPTPLLQLWSFLWVAVLQMNQVLHGLSTDCCSFRKYALTLELGAPWSALWKPNETIQLVILSFEIRACLNAHRWLSPLYLSEHIQETRRLTLLQVCFACWRWVNFMYVVPSIDEKNYKEAQQGDSPVSQCFSQNGMHRQRKNVKGNSSGHCGPCVVLVYV